MSQPHDDVIAQNRRMWNETAAVHARVDLDRLVAAFEAGDFSTLDPIERRIFATLGIERGPDVAQLCCNNARELISVKLAGAGRVTGFDLSEAFLAQGERLARAAGVEVGLVAGSVYDIGPEHTGAYDIVYVTVGALGWLPDLARFIAIAARLLRPGGALFIYEMHPILGLFEPDSGLAVRNPYFRREPYRFDGDADYLDPGVVITEPSYWFQHTLADVLGGVLAAGLKVERFEEHPHDVSTIFAHLAPEGLLPMTYVLVARR